MRILQVSDTHHSVSHSYFKENLSATMRWLSAAPADLVVHTGDLSMDGAGDHRDLSAGAQWMGRLAPQTLITPGNHDVGDHVTIKPNQLVDDRRLECWRDLVGPDWWFIDREGWRLIGLNAMLAGTGHPDEARQLDWFAAALQTTSPVALFLHKPLFIDHPEEGPRGYWTIRPEPRRIWLDLMDRADLRLVASGHLHIHCQFKLGPTDYVWGPASSFVVGDSQEDLGGTRRLGVMVHDFSKNDVVSRYLRPDGLEDLLIEPVADTIYPPSKSMA